MARGRPGLDVCRPRLGRGIVREDDVVIADLKTGRMLPSTTGKIVASPHPVWWVPDHEERRQDVRRFFDTAVDNDVRREILERWHARFIFVDMTSKGSRDLVDELGDLASEERRDQRYRLFRVR